MESQLAPVNLIFLNISPLKSLNLVWIPGVKLDSHWGTWTGSFWKHVLLIVPKPLWYLSKPGSPATCNPLYWVTLSKFSSWYLRTGFLKFSFVNATWISCFLPVLGVPCVKVTANTHWRYQHHIENNEFLAWVYLLMRKSVFTKSWKKIEKNVCKVVRTIMEIHRGRIRKDLLRCFHWLPRKYGQTEY